MTNFFNLASAIFALTAAFLWFRSTTVKVPPDNKLNAEWQSASIEVNGSDFIATAIKQAKLSKRAASFAALAALFQGLVTIITMISP